MLGLNMELRSGDGDEIEDFLVIVRSRQGDLDFAELDVMVEVFRCAASRALRERRAAPIPPVD